MNLTFQLGWWIAPALVTVAAFGWSWLYLGRLNQESRGYVDLVGGFIVLVLTACSAMVTLVAWLIWALAV